MLRASFGSKSNSKLKYEKLCEDNSTDKPCGDGMFAHKTINMI